MSGLKRSTYVAQPRIGSETPEQASSVYQGFYGEMPIPATAYAASAAPLHSKDIVPSLQTRASNASVVDRKDRRNGMIMTAGRQSYTTPVAPTNKPVESSKFQTELVGPQVNYILNACLYRCGFPAATFMNGGRRNQALSFRVDQLPTRTSGGPGSSVMASAPRFKKVQTINRYSTMPQAYNTQGTQS